MKEEGGNLRHLRNWWMETAEADIEATLPKVSEYTAADLEIMGEVLEQWGVASQVNPGGGQEAACMFYILGKVARSVAAYREGRLPSEDTLKDIVVYAMMIRRIRATGGWPGEHKVKCVGCTQNTISTECPVHSTGFGN